MADVFSRKQKRKIAGGARTLLERLEKPGVSVQAEESELDGEEILQAWRELFPDETAFERRLKDQGITKDECREAARADTLDPDEPIPKWVNELERLVEAVRQHTPDTVSEGPSSNWDLLHKSRPEEWAFGELTVVIGAYTCDKLRDEFADTRVTESAVRSLFIWFNDKIEDLSWQLLFTIFKSNVASQRPELASVEPGELDDPSTEYYEEFMEYLFSGGFSQLCLEYPVFSRLLATEIRHWVNKTREFCQRCRADRERLANHFDTEGPLETIVDLEPLSDHTFEEGRTVMRVEFGEGLTVAYKPRDVRSGDMFYRIFDRINNHLPTQRIKSPKYLVAEEYGWMEWLEHTECESEAEVEHYYRQAGALACIAYFLELRDCSVENLLAVGQEPLLVDAETVLFPYLEADRRPANTSIVGALGDESVLLTHLFPCDFDDLYSEESGSQTPSEIAGLRKSASESAPVVPTETVIRDKNTDVMTVEEERSVNGERTNLPTFDGVERPPENHVEEIVGGFRSTYETILQLRDENRLFGERGLLRDSKEIQTRSVYRSNYSSILRELTTSERLSDGVVFGLGMEQLTIPFYDNQVAGPVPFSLYEAERAAIKRLEIPRFTCKVSDTKVKGSRGEVRLRADKSGLQRCRERVESASREDLRYQLEIIRGCFGGIPAPQAEMTPRPANRQKQISDQRFQSEAATLFERIRDTAYQATDGSFHWSSIKPWTASERLTLRPVDGSLYFGKCGIALLAAALYQATGDDEYRLFAYETIAPICQAVRSENHRPSLENHGGVLGIGSVAYGLSAVGSVLCDRRVLDDAAQVGGFVTDDSFGNAEAHRVSGTLLGLLPTYTRTGQSSVLTAATECGDYLLKSITEREDGTPVSAEGGQRVSLIETDHGAGMVAYALIRLWDATGESAYHDAAVRVLKTGIGRRAEYADTESKEESSPQRRPVEKWRSERQVERWTQLGISEFVSDKHVSRELERTESETPMTEYDPIESPDGGTGQSVEFILELERRRKRSAGRAREILGRVMDRKRETGAYRLPTRTDRVVDPTLFYGHTGLAYAMLRISTPNPLPCVFLWE